MSDMFALGATTAVRPSPGAFLLLSFDETLFFDSFFDRIVSISEDSETFHNLLSFIYPDKSPTLFTNLDGLLPVLSAASKYQMGAIVDMLKAQIMSRSISGNTHIEALLYDDPLRVYVKAKEFDLGDLVDAAVNATFNVDIARAPDPCSDVARMPAIWLWQLQDIRKERTDWMMKKCDAEFFIGSMDSQYEYQVDKHLCCFPRSRCSCGQNEFDYGKKTPESLLNRIKAYPCPRAIRKIDFHVALGCLRCGAAATAHFNRICKEYEDAFGTF
jgi:hypothetical protein